MGKIVCCVTYAIVYIRCVYLYESQLYEKSGTADDASVA